MEQEKMTSLSNRGAPIINRATQLTDFKKTHIPKQKCFSAISCVKRPGECVPEQDVFLVETFLILLLTLGHIIVKINKLDIAKDKINQ